MRGVDYDDVDSGLDEGSRPVLSVVADAYRRSDAQTPVAVLRGVREGLRLQYVFYRDEPFEHVVLVDDGKLFDFGAHEDALRVVERRSDWGGDEVVLRHYVRYRLVKVGDEAQVAVRDYADEAYRVVNDGNA